MIIAVLLSISHAALAVGEPTVTIAFDKESVDVGETVTATYKVSGEGNYTGVSYNWFIYTDNDEGQPLESEFSEELEGEVVFSPRFGQGAFLVFRVKDENEREYEFVFRDKEITITGDNSKEPSVILFLNKSEVNVGEEVTATYIVSGEGTYTKVYYNWFVYPDEESVQSPSGAVGDTDSLNGQLLFTPSFGIALMCSITVEDSNGRYYYYDSEKIPVFGDETVEPSVEVEYNKNTVAIGETITATYRINGIDEFKEIGYFWVIGVEENGKEKWEEYSVHYGNVNTLAGSISLKPQYGVKIRCNIDMTDKYGKYYRFENEGIRISGVAPEYEVYSVIEGSNTQISIGENNLTFRANGEFDQYLGVQVDGKTVPSKYVKAWAGSTYVELSAEYLATLSEGEHELTIIFDDGVAVTKFTTMKKLSELPQTGDTGLPIAFLLLTMTISICGFALMAKRRIN